MAHIVNKLALPFFILAAVVLSTIALGPTVQSWPQAPTLAFCFTVTAIGGGAVSWLYVAIMLLTERAQDARMA
jgi:hypothetical protein